MVQPSYTARVYRPNPISIHLMLWFNLAICFYIVFIILFQYILCYGSTSILEELKKGND